MGRIMIAEIAKVCHEVNRAYCLSLGDKSQPSWEAAPDWQRQSAIDGVDFHLRNSNAGPEASHENWLKLKSNQNWKHGPVKDSAKKEHPCCIPFDQLPTEQKAKDYIFRQIVHSMKELM